MAVGAYPVVSKLSPTVFLKVLAVSEIAVGSVLLFPVVPAGLAGIVLTGFAGSLLGLYVRTPALHDSKLRPTQAGNGGVQGHLDGRHRHRPDRGRGSRRITGHRHRVTESRRRLRWMRAVLRGCRSARCDRGRQ